MPDIAAFLIPIERAMADVTLELLVSVWVGAFIGGIAVGGAGFAFALTASSIWLHVLDPVHTTILIVACGTILHVGLMWPLRRAIDASRASPFVIAGVIGTPIGVYLLARTDANSLKLALGVLLTIYGTYALAAPRLPVIKGGGRAADATIGFIGGILGGIGGYSGVLPTIWTQLRGWPKEIARGVCQPFILVVQIVTLILAGFLALDPFDLVLIGASLPALLVGGWVGWQIYGWLDERRFRQMLSALLLISGLMLIS